MLRLRVLSAIILSPIILALIYLGGMPWLLTVLVIGVLGWREMAHILGRHGYTVHQWLGLLFVAGAVSEAYIHASGLLTADLLRPLLTGLILLSLIWALVNTDGHPVADWGLTVAGALYLGFMLGHFVTLRTLPNGRSWVYLALLVTWTSDTTAYFVGRTVGRHPWWPRLSPKKTWEGLVGGTLGALIGAPLLGAWLLGLPLLPGLLLGALVAVVAPLGDLAVSLFKRMAQVKDSSNLIPGHGGVLDRLDSLLFTVPVVTYFALVVIGT